MFDVNVFKDGFDESPTNTFGFREVIVKERLKYVYASIVYTLEFQPGLFEILEIVDESIILILLE
jgi:hypothetical protein